MQSLASANVTTRATEWSSINWRKSTKIVRNLRQRIFRASQDGDLKKVRSLQKLLLRSYSNVVMSVRRVCQVNRGRNTAGVDKVLVKTPEARGKLVDELREYQPWQTKPARRVYIPKNNGKRRPLGRPTIRDRCMQAIVKNALEPFWEAKFERSSYGFRPGRSCHDAIVRIFFLARSTSKKKIIVDADIKGAFDNIAHIPLLEAIAGFPARELIKQWLKAGYMEEETFIPTEAGTPQGGVISPLLANIALHGMEEALNIRYNKAGELISKRGLVRYADDFVVFCENEEDAQTVIPLLTKWLGVRGLALSPEKTSIRHISQGFDFLGFNVRQYAMPHTTRTGWKVLIKPSRQSVAKLKEKLHQEWVALRGHNPDAVVRRLNPIIRGWANYFRIGVSSKIFSDLDSWMFTRQVIYAKQRHRNKPWPWVRARYWGKFNPHSNSQWVFGDGLSGHYLLRFGGVRIRRHIMVKGASSPDDPALKLYWQQRNARKAADLPPKYQPLAHRQYNLCYHCGDSLFNGEEVHRHHIIPLEDGGEDHFSNIVFVHLFCHQQIHARRLDSAALT